MQLIKISLTSQYFQARAACVCVNMCAIKRAADLAIDRIMRPSRAFGLLTKTSRHGCRVAKKAATRSLKQRQKSPFSHFASFSHPNRRNVVRLRHNWRTCVIKGCRGSCEHKTMTLILALKTISGQQPASNECDTLLCRMPTILVQSRSQPSGVSAKVIKNFDSVARDSKS